jgi:putative transcriptional regulator
MVNNELREIRQKREIQLIDLAKAVDVSRQTIHAIESSKYTPSVELALKIAKFLKLRVEDIFKLPRSSK